ncbi:YvcK family protein [Ktedonosporobacter rubrisoli]|uniref:Putative gluconeogenesis factor n=1 Tax=Ktedonosporobacter rubrisoli TaxID=2509675 RepID=A0A4P6JV07_KTERU|nr:gluconeogenesis factor YvcK family protein [Ktedonosporobacter rubrisoli]QBD79225.1 YvcK family protein [Ktedonosporobacter rubrisoli]
MDTETGTSLKRQFLEPRHTGDRFAGRRVVTIGGGSGTFSVLSHLKKYPFNITAVVNMSDSGGSSRLLMDEFRRQLPLGDLRMSLVALARNGALWRDVFMHRFERTEESSGDSNDRVSGHSLGNLILKGLQDINRDNLLLAIEDAEELLNTAGKVVPVTLEQTAICAELEDGTTICSETEIDTRGKKHPNSTLPPIKRLRLVPEDAQACLQAIRAIRRADTIIIGPGDLYTSLLPNLLVSGIARAVRESEAEKVYVCNLMTKHGETDGYKASDFINEIHRYLGARVDRVILNDGTYQPDVLKMYQEEQSEPVVIDRPRVARLVPNMVVAHLNLEDDSLARHDPERLVRAIFQFEED